MISIIISTTNADYLSAVKQNIEATIGVPYEIIAINNQDGARGLCEIYNLGASRAIFDTLCFMHEDLEFKTVNWGKNVLNHFNKDKSLGLIGVVGGTYKSSVFSGWGPYGSIDRIDYANILQRYKFKKAPTSYYYRNPENLKIKEVAVLDGVWLCTSKKIISKYPFDQETFKKFHCYDIDICLSVGCEYRIAVVYDVLIEHFSEGRFEKEWADATIALHQKWKDKLPVNKAGYTQKEILVCEKKSFRNVLPFLIDWGYSLKQIIKLLNLSIIRRHDWFLYSKLYMTAVKRFVFKK